MNKNFLNGGIAIIALAVAVMNYFSITELNSVAENSPHDATQKTTNNEEEKHYELAKAMSYMQRYSQKLFFAGENENWELSGFYTHELEETIEEMEEAQVKEEDYDISALVGTMTEPALEKLEDAIKEKDAQSFADSYKLLVKSCNSCHQVTEHQFIKIKVPEMGEAYNQQFKK